LASRSVALDVLDEKLGKINACSFRVSLAILELMILSFQLDRLQDIDRLLVRTSSVTVMLCVLSELFRTIFNEFESIHFQ
jgi:hypothetical protein